MAKKPILDRPPLELYSVVLRPLLAIGVGTIGSSSATCWALEGTS